MSSDQVIEHIFLATDEEPEQVILATDEQPEARPRITDYKFRQSSQAKGYRATYEVFNGHHLEVRVRRIYAKPRRYTLDLAFLAAEPVRRITIDWPLLAAASIATLVTALLTTYLYYAAQPPLLSPWLPVAVVTGTTAAVVGLLGLYRSSDKLVFHSRHGRAPLLELLNRGHRNKEFRSFVDDITERVRRARAQRHGSARDLLAAELREHRRLKEEAIIDEQAYAVARAQILECHRPK